MDKEAWFKFVCSQKWASDFRNGQCFLILHGWNLGRKTDVFPSYILLRSDGTKAIFRNLESAVTWQRGRY
jgi:hypothetical protein